MPKNPKTTTRTRRIANVEQGPRTSARLQRAIRRRQRVNVLIEAGTVAAAVGLLLFTRIGPYPILATTALGYFLLSLGGYT